MADTTAIPDNYVPLSPDQKSQWNGFASYLGQQNAGKSLDENPDLGHAYMQQYSNRNPSFTLTPDQIPHIQYEQQQIRSGDNPLASLGNDSYYNRKTSEPNGQINSLTASSLYPTVATRDANGKVITDYGTDTDRFLAENPTAITSGPGKKTATTPSPAAASPSKFVPSAAYVPPVIHRDATGTAVRAPFSADFKTGHENDPGNAPVPIDTNNKDQTGPLTPYKQLSDAYNKTGQDFTNSLYDHEKTDYSNSPMIKVMGGKDPGISVPADMIKDVAMAAKRQGYDPYKLLGQLSLESSFGTDTDTGTKGVKSDYRTAQFQSVNLDEPYRPLPVEQFMEQHGVPGVKAVPDKRFGYTYQVSDEDKMNDYLTKHPEIVKAYQDHLTARDKVPDTYNTYDEAAKRDKTGLKNYNADPAYAVQVQKYAASLKNDKNVKAIIDSLQ